MTCGFVNRLCSGSNVLPYMADGDYGPLPPVCQISIGLNAPSVPSGPHLDPETTQTGSVCQREEIKPGKTTGADTCSHFWV